MTQITFLLSIITLLALLFVIAYIYGKGKAKKVIKYSLLIPLIIISIIMFVLIMGNIFNWFSNFLPNIDWFPILILLLICLGGATNANLDTKKNKKEDRNN
jgi:formate hydrogenlyase subunit 3/multisubunit Na+/H+ antiporter MnhD subunit